MDIIESIRDRLSNPTNDRFVLTRVALSEVLEALRTHEQDAKDASRYRWLKPHLDHANFEPDDGEGIDLVFNLPVTMAVSANLDATIDAAIAASQPPDAGEGREGS